MLPARDHAALRPMRAVSTSRAQRPTVSAATAGSNTPLTTCIAPFASSTGQKLGAIAMTTAPIDSASRPHSMARALVPCTIEPRADRHLRRKAKPATDGADQSRGRRGPALFGNQKNHDIGPEPAAHIGNQEIQPIERRRMQILRRQPLAHAGAAFAHRTRATPQSR